MNKYALQDGVVLDSILLPKQPDRSFTLTVPNSIGTISNGIPSTVIDSRKEWGHFYFAGQTGSGVWADSLVWTAQDAHGTIIGQVSQHVQSNRTAGDTLLAMLWAGSSPNPYSDVFTSPGNLGCIFGFVDRGYSMIALNSDTVSKAQQTAIENGKIPLIGTDTMYFQRDSSKVTIATNSKLARSQSGLNDIVCCLGSVKIMFNIEASKNAELRIYDLFGRMVAQFSYADLVGHSEIFLQTRSRASGIYVAVLKMDNRLFTKSFSIVK